MCNKYSNLRVLILVGIFWVFVGAVSADENRYAVVQEDSAEVYQHRRSQKEHEFVLEKDQRVVVLGTKGSMVKIREDSGRDGWVSKEKVKIIDKSATYSFGDAEVMGYLDDPTPFYILDTENPDEEVLQLNRSFQPLLKSNFDKHTAERMIETREKG